MNDLTTVAVSVDPQLWPCMGHPHPGMQYRTTYEGAILMKVLGFLIPIPFVLYVMRGVWMGINNANEARKRKETERFLAQQKLRQTDRNAD